MRKKQILSIGIMLVFLASFTVNFTVQANPPPEIVHIYRYLDDDASYDSYTSGSGTKYVTHGDIDNIRLYTRTNVWLSTAGAYSLIDGGHDDNSPWTFSSSESYSLKVYWKISGTFDDAWGGSNYFKFTYTLYHMSGSSEVVDMSNTYTYTSDFNYNAQTVSHTVGTESLSTSTNYYLECKISLYHSLFSSITTSDMYYGANHIEFTKADFYFLYYY